MITIPFLVWLVVMCLLYHQLRIRRFDVIEAVLLAFFWPIGVIELIITPRPKGEERGDYP